MIRRNFRTKAGIAAPASSTAANDAGYYSNQATMTGLEENTEYVYRVVNGDTVSQTYSFATGEFDGNSPLHLLETRRSEQVPQIQISRVGTRHWM